MFPGEPTERGPQSPPESKPVPTVGPANTFEIRVETHRDIIRERQANANGVHTVSESTLAVEEIAIQGARLVIQSCRKRVSQTNRPDAECRIRTRPIVNDNLGGKAFDQSVTDVAIDWR